MTQMTILSLAHRNVFAADDPKATNLPLDGVPFGHVFTRRRPSLMVLGLVAMTAWFMAAPVYSAFLVMAAT